MSERLAAFERLTEENPQSRRSRLALALVVGDSAERATAREVMDTLDLRAIATELATVTADARWWRLTEELLLALKRRGELSPFQAGALALTGLNHGSVSEAMARLAEPGVAAAWRTCAPVLLYLEGVPVSDERIDSVASPTAIDTTIGVVHYCAGLYGAERRRWDDHEWLVDRLEARSNEEGARGDTLAARQSAAFARAIRGYVEWKRVRHQAAFELMDGARREGAFFFIDLIGDLRLEQGDVQDAVRYYRAEWVSPLTRLKLARAYELLGEREKAREAYAYFIEAWADADPELQPVVEQAKESMARLRDDR